ncbi:MAG: transcriptional regulator [Balneola sp.]|nr:transcriptional regulator [Balneola sp.]|tara:strand:- start:25706 stop:25930 length:225 start_codon:yes stop_codon:yes gene_type:complete
MKSKEEIQSIIGINVKRAREKAGLSQFDLGLESDLHRNMIDLVERGQTMPTVYTLIKIAKALETSLAELTKGVE